MKKTEKPQPRPVPQPERLVKVPFDASQVHQGADGGWYIRKPPSN